MKVALELAKTIEENANYYYEKAKKAKKKIIGLNKAYAKTKEKVERLQLNMDVEKPKKEKKIKRKKE
ncbi:MAG: fibronectin-binding domain-containing protein, partial [Candidatus Woesearchaeota archaeon]